MAEVPEMKHVPVSVASPTLQRPARAQPLRPAQAAPTRPAANVLQRHPGFGQLSLDLRRAR
jgi:hypothetical protein